MSRLASRRFLAARQCAPATPHRGIRAWDRGEAGGYSAMRARGGRSAVAGRNIVAYGVGRGEAENRGGEGGRIGGMGDEESESEGEGEREWWEEEFSDSAEGEKWAHESAGEGGNDAQSGEEQAGAEEARRVAVVAYLEGEGVAAELLEGVALPLDVRVVRERVQFLRALRLDVAEVVGRYPPVLCGSIARNYVPVLAHLESIPIARAHLPALLTAYPRVLFSSVRIDLQPVLHYLTGLGVPPAALPSVLTRCPHLLGLRPEGSMSTSVAYLVGVGVDPKAVGAMVVQLPHLLTMRAATTIRPKVELLSHALALPLPQVATLLQARPHLLALDLHAQLHPALAALRAAGLTVPHMRAAVTAFPHLLALPLSDLLPPTVQWLSSHAHVPPAAVAGVLAGLPQLVVADRRQAEGKLQRLRERGFSQQQVTALLVGCPQVLGQRADTIERKLAILLQHRTHADVVAFPPCLACREEVLEERLGAAQAAGVRGPLEWLLDCPPETFHERLRTEFVVLPPPVEVVIQERE
ncbi:unnamed protein product [Closterium sp. NIES-64]|nr:unnamed protein product [Closterium sp. NIES-64]